MRVSDRKEIETIPGGSPAKALLRPDSPPAPMCRSPAVELTLVPITFPAVPSHGKYRHDMFCELRPDDCFGCAGFMAQNGQFFPSPPQVDA
jgi:hypothetical protein